MNAKTTGVLHDLEDECIKPQNKTLNSTGKLPEVDGVQTNSTMGCERTESLSFILNLMTELGFAYLSQNP